MKLDFLQKGGKVNGKTAPNDGDEAVIPTGKEGGIDMNPSMWKKKPTLQPKQPVKKEPTYKLKPKESVKKVEQKKIGGKMKRKCSCGCDLKISKNAKGGIIEVCSCKCGGKMKKK